MTLPELNELLKTTGLPVTYLAWPEGQAPALPFICYHSTGATTLYADAAVYHPWDDVQVVLYTAKKDLAAESAVEAVLNGFRWTKSETYISTELCYMITYEIEV